MSKAKRGAEIEALINRQMRLWDSMAQRNRAQEAPTTVHSKKIGPYVTLSRFIGTGGDEIAKIVAEKLGWQEFDKEIVEYIAAQARVRESIVASFDEKIQNELFIWVENLLTWSSMDNMHYLKQLSQVIYAIARHGRAIIVGRGANFIVPEGNGLRVRISAPVDWRVQYLMQHQDLPKAKAEEAIKNRDEMQRTFILRHFHQDIDDCTNYDLVLNPGTLGIDQCAEIIIENVQKHECP